jgi:hypothetical protein
MICCFVIYGAVLKVNKEKREAPSAISCLSSKRLTPRPKELTLLKFLGSGFNPAVGIPKEFLGGSL